jgi:hypothetical protein
MDRQQTDWEIEIQTNGQTDRKELKWQKETDFWTRLNWKESPCFTINLPIAIHSHRQQNQGQIMNYPLSIPPNDNNTITTLCHRRLLYRRIRPSLSIFKISKNFKWSDNNNNRMFQKNLKIKKVFFPTFWCIFLKFKKQTWTLQSWPDL